MEAHLPETTKSNHLPAVETSYPNSPLLGELGGSRESSGLLLFPTCCPTFQSNRIDDMGDGGFAAAHMACKCLSVVSQQHEERE